MKALIIVLAILFLLLLILFSKVRLRISYTGRIRLFVSYLFVKVPLYPRKKRKKRKKKRKKKEKKQPEKKAEKHGEAPNAPAAKRPLSLGDIRFLVRVLSDALSGILSRASRHVRVTVNELSLTVGGADDAARAALEYGVLVQSASYLVALCEDTKLLSPVKPSALNLGVNFLSHENIFRFRATVSYPLIFLVPLLFTSLKKALTARSRWIRHGASKAKLQKKEKHHG